eukprot:scaffold29803_cov107-Isochrysis_galbana.AAC.5
MACLSTAEMLRHWTLRMHSFTIDAGSEEGKGRPEDGGLAARKAGSAPPVLAPSSSGGTAGERGADAGDSTAMVGAAPNDEKRFSWSSSNIRLVQFADEGCVVPRAWDLQIDRARAQPLLSPAQRHRVLYCGWLCRTL